MSFNRAEALRKAMLTFWRHGYESTSLSDLTAAMGVTPPSLYAAFGNKKHLFLEAVRLYLSGPVTTEMIIKNAPTAREAAWRLLQGAAISYTGTDTPPGCLLASSAISCSPLAADVQEELAGIRRTIESSLRKKILRAIKKGEMKASGDADGLAGHIMAVIQGMSTLARDGASRKKLMGIAERAMQAWPG